MMGIIPKNLYFTIWASTVVTPAQRGLHPLAMPLGVMS